ELAYRISEIDFGIVLLDDCPSVEFATFSSLSFTTFTWTQVASFAEEQVSRHSSERVEPIHTHTYTSSAIPHLTLDQNILQLYLPRAHQYDARLTLQISHRHNTPQHGWEIDDEAFQPGRFIR